jgi:hypothetical protein
MRGDRVEIVVDTGNGTQEFQMEATRAGRRLEVTTARGVVEVNEVTRTGQVVRTARFMANRVVALVEHPGEISSEETSARKKPPTNQASLLGEGLS